MERQKRRLVVPFLLPAFAAYAFFMLYPAFSTFYVALTDWNGVSAPDFVGLGNLTELAADETFRSTIGNTVTFVVIGAMILFPGALFFAYVTQKLRFGKVYRFFILAPVVLSVTTAALLWKFLLNPNFGVVGVELLGQPSTAMLMVVLATVWHGIGIWMLLFAAAFERVPVELREAATLDGASAFQVFRHVVWPLIWDVTRTLLILWMIQGLQTFAFIIAMTGGGPLRSTEVIGTYLYGVAFTEGRFGYAATIAVVLFAAILTLTLSVNRLTKRESEQY
ncbi:carbohydrate ABC transporter permease [Micromonospora cathayae]|uniref:Sugar ABC transporter permease n=1 Tax=Micromonospora cathayae TaxID=3028804 RepID=A0ABY7ZI81_9ACTN|nr:sugar ABC transporter permease [Micromonospora sp. HUAS 3]WDZ82660.1 sugar ABC transporter permease [Micromonospora sp. HUAS 3]